MSRLARLWRTHRAAVLIIGGLAAVLLAVAFFWPITDLMAAHDVGRVAASQRAAHLQTAREAVRTQFLTLAVGLAVVGTLWFTGQNYRLSRQGQVTDLYTRAIEQLGSEKLDVRIGAVYALERVARDSAIDHPTVMEVLTAFVREHSHEPWPPSATDKPEAAPPVNMTRPDVQAALTVIARRDSQQDREGIDLRDARLPGAFLVGANLAHADLVGAKLPGAQLSGADLAHAFFCIADLTGAFLHEADLTEADLTRANLTHADLSGANLTGARLDDVNLTDAHLAGMFLVNAGPAGATIADANLSGARLTGANLTGATWPNEMPVPEGWVLDPSSGRLRRANADADYSGN